VSLLKTMALWTRLSVAVMMAVLWFAHLGVPDSAADTIGGPVNWGAGEGPAGDYDFPSEDCTGNHTDPVGVLDLPPINRSRGSGVRRLRGSCCVDPRIRSG
jgi:hypothetical protein